MCEWTRPVQSQTRSRGGPSFVARRDHFLVLNFWICIYSGGLTAFHEASNCVKHNCLSRLLESFRQCYGRCLEFAGDAALPRAAVDLYRAPPLKRQVDPLQSCIEARCAGTHKGLYGRCVYSRCLTGIFKTARKRISLHDLILESSTSQLPFDDTMEGKDEELPAAIAFLEDEIGELLRENDVRLSDYVSSQTPFHDSHRKPSVYLGDILPRRRSSFSKRSWNDIVQNCIMYHCRRKKPGSAAYNVCVQVHCSKLQMGRRESRESRSSSSEEKEEEWFWITKPHSSHIQVRLHPLLVLETLKSISFRKKQTCVQCRIPSRVRQHDNSSHPLSLMSNNSTTTHSIWMIKFSLET